MIEKIRKCVFPAAGFGTRFLPVTKSMPKEMLPLLGKPLIHYGVEESYKAGMNDITFIVGRNKEAIVNYFDVNFELEARIKDTPKEKLLQPIRTLLDKCSFSYMRQREIRGLGNAILCAKCHIEQNPFAVLLADDLCFADPGKEVLSRMQEIYAQEKCTILAVTEINPVQSWNYGIIDGSPIADNLFEVKGMVEKPRPEDAPSNLAIIGRYILMPSIFNYLERIPLGKDNELQITDALAEQLKDDKILAYKVEAKRFDCGSHEGFKQALLYKFNQKED